MKYMREAVTGILLTLLLSLAACGTKKEPEQPAAGEMIIQEPEDEKAVITEIEEASSSIINYEALGIREYEYPSEFDMGDNLKMAITQLALSYDQFDRATVDSESWEEIFVARFIQNSRASFAYLDMASKENNGQIGAQELNYIQYSLTGVELDFSAYEGGSIDRYDAASAYNYGSICGYEYEETDNGVIVTADFEVGYDGTESVQERRLTIVLVKNPYSCFDGDTVVSISTETAASSAGQEGGTYVFYGTDMMEEDHGGFSFELLYAEDELHYGHFVYVDMTELPEFADLVRQNAGSDFKVTFILNGEQADRIDRVVPFDVTLVE